MKDTRNKICPGDKCKNLALSEGKVIDIARKAFTNFE